jgi:hypothetical protein
MVKADKRLFGGGEAAAVSATGRSRVVENESEAALDLVWRQLGCEPSD